MRCVVYILIICWSAVACLPRARADAIVVNRSMLAPTIAEIFVEKDRIRVALEIGIVDFKAFQNVLPDEVYEKLVKKPELLKDRYGSFFQQDWLVRADGNILVPTLKSIEGRQRSRRDEISGEVLANAEGDEGMVLSVILEYRA